MNEKKDEKGEFDDIKAIVDNYDNDSVIRARRREATPKCYGRTEYDIVGNFCYET